MSFKKFMSLTLLTLLLLSSVFTNSLFASEEVVAEQKPKSSSEVFRIEELDEHPDVVEFLEKNHLYDELQEFVDNPDVQPLEKSDTNFSAEEKKRLEEKYGLVMSEPTTEPIQNDIQIGVIRNADDIDGLIAIRLLAYDWGCNLELVHLQLGVDPVDSIIGTVTKYNKDGRSWDWVDSKPVKETNVKSGSFYGWRTRISAVADYFEFDLTVTDEGNSLPYTNKGIINASNERYNFNTDIYKELSSLGGHRHHLVSKKALEVAGFDPNYAPAIRMIVEDHYNTPNYGGNTKFRQKEIELLKKQKYSELIEFELEALANSEDSEERFDNLYFKYEEELGEAVLMYEDYFGSNEN
ncbi:hypothetical protein LOK74_22015 [Brevibacillus humidisoli]|uniref:hypothetical protein n=1 Tax=Brevibacillus humidisoli TaxID=2895522 RepID=UPI001E5DA8B1|nr:hypothetical protein [Brevibacillus humidisoli]UFJ40653.1 hypothetical protein LOK74_22015 [Brevibacillus humidisoli]